MIATLQRISYSLNKRQFARNVLLMTSGTVLAQGILALSSPILTRLYTPEQVGVFTLYFSVVSLLAVINSLRYEAALSLPDNEEDAVHLLVLCLLIVFTISLVVGITFALFAPSFAEWMQIPDFASYLWLVGLGSFFAGIYQVLNFWSTRQKTFRQSAQAQIIQSLTMVFFQVLLGLMMIGVGGLLLGFIIAQCVGSLLLFRLAWQKNLKGIQSIFLARIRAVASEYRRFPLLSTGATLLNRLNAVIPLVALTALYGSSVAGLYGLGYRVILTPTSIIVAGLSQVYLRSAVDVLRESPIALQKFFMRLAVRLFLISVVPMLLLLLFSPIVFELVFGEEWKTAGEYVQIMAPLVALQFVLAPLSLTIYVIERQDIHMKWEATNLILVSALFVAAFVFRLEAKSAIMLYTGAMMSTYAVLFFLYRRALKQLIVESVG